MKRLALTVLCFMAVAAIGLATYLMSMDQQIDIARRHSRVQLEAYQNIFLAKINKYRHLPFVISKERDILRLLEKRSDQLKANILLKAIQIRSGASALFVMNEHGDTIASSNYDEPNSFVGKNYGFRPYFKRAMQGREGSMYARGATTGVPGYFLSYPIYLKSKIAGVAVVKFNDLSELQDTWRATNNVILAQDPNGIIVLSNKKDWLYKTLEPLSVSQLELARKGRLYSGSSLTQLDISKGTSLGAKWIEIDGTRYLFSELWVQGKRWELFALVPWTSISDISLRKGLIACLASVATLAGLMLFLAHRQRKIMERKIESSRRARRIGEEREESLRLLADSIAHQIRNPLIGIGGNANLLKRKLPHDEVLVELLETIIDCCRDLEQLVTAVRNYINIVPSSTAPCDLKALVMDSQAEAVAEVKPPDGAVNWLIDMEPATLPLDATQMGRALYEVLGNALEARDGDTISIRITGEWKTARECDSQFEIPSDKWYVLTICDSGRGIDAETYAHILEPFYSTKPRGTGLGLAKVKRVLQIFHGDFSITSPVPDTEDCNTMVQLTLPLLADLKIEQ